MYLNIIVEGSTEEFFVNDVLRAHFAPLGIFVSARKILTGWDKLGAKPAKGGLLKYNWLKRDIESWIAADRGRLDAFYTTFVDLYAFPKDSESPYVEDIRIMKGCYEKIRALEGAIDSDINHPRFFSYVQLHEFETFLMVSPERLLTMYPDKQAAVRRLKADIGNIPAEEINESPHTAPSKRIIRQIPEYEGQKAQVGPLVAEDIGISLLRENCNHFNDWITKMENLTLK